MGYMGYGGMEGMGGIRSMGGGWGGGKLVRLKCRFYQYKFKFSSSSRRYN